MTAPIVSIIIPCYRQAQFLATAVESALEQTFQAVEVIVVNDGSDDDTEEVALSYGDRIRYIKRANGGLPAARNTGIRHATGRYLLFLDSDDVLHLDALRQLMTAMDGHDNRLCVMGFQMFAGSVEQGLGKRHFPPDHTVDALGALLRDNFAVPHSFLCLRQAVLDEGGFEESLRSCEDWDLWCRLALRGAEVIAIPFCGAYYRHYAGSMSTNVGRMLHTRTQVLLRIKERLVREPSLLNKYGADLLESAQGAARRLRVQNGDKQLRAEIVGVIRDLRNLGFRPHASLPRRCLDALIGYRSAEAIALSTLRFLRPESYLSYSRRYV
jgi:glycosyltransferase involved in cell wall biosynthesis